MLLRNQNTPNCTKLQLGFKHIKRKKILKRNFYVKHGKWVLSCFNYFYRCLELVAITCC